MISNNKLFFTSILAAACLIAFSTEIQAQTYDEIESTQDAIESTYYKVYDIIEEYPAVAYSYVFEDGDIVGVNIEGIDVNQAAKQLEVYLLAIEDLKDEIRNMRTRFGVYYVSETEPKPKMGYNDFYDDLQKRVQYPEMAEDRGVEGTIFVKFVVDDTGNVQHAVASEKVETDATWLIDDLKEEAIRVVESTSGEWIPAKVGNVPVGHYVVLPVQFKIENPLYRPIYPAF